MSRSCFDYEDEGFRQTAEQVLPVCDQRTSSQLRVEIGEYIVLRCQSLTTKMVWFRVYRKGVLDGLSDHRSLVSATQAAKRYIARDAVRQEENETANEYVRDNGQFGVGA